MKLLLTGAEGQLGFHLVPYLARLGELVTTSRRSGDRPADLTDPAALSRLLDAVRPDVIVNPAAWTAVDAAEEQPEAADRLNRWLPETLADWCRHNGALLVHYSTDYVFHGAPGRPWTERDVTDPVSVYGYTKRAGERAVLGSGARAVVLRTAWLYSACPGNFLSAILARAGRGEGLRVVSDQIGSPTWAGSLAEMTADLLRNDLARPGGSILHAADRGCMSWHDFAGMAVTMAAERGLIDEAVPVEPIDSSQWPQKAARPCWSVLDVAAMEAACGRQLPTTKQALSACLDQWK
ncbi:dTDP-4-dehydrorhamnose reductase [Wenzhouxiangella limi]|uniref:dTDP-4-dehydrorhamnose reductase n=1 Tax=Wenzhouxiangella limi TaxID=2707351 RepID=A0A845V203_9GAMM|nr:dTDP-4-dehydrorhamnose reductase [Wenzhouxiangella limi]NDY96744.1 dTDP-4-dehydrorhamnose reductase [Wenzhouxiangella limi]